MAVSSKVSPEVKKQDLQFQIQMLRTQSSSCATEGVLVTVLSILTAVFLPELILRVLLARNSDLTAPPEFLGYVPFVAYVIGMVYGVWVLVLNGLRSKQVKALLSEMSSLK